MIETSDAAKWIYNRLVSDSQIAGLVGSRVYESEIPRGASYPAIVFALQDGDVRRGTGARRVFTRASYQIKAVDQSESFGSIESIANQIDNLFNQDQMTSDDTVIGCSTLKPFQYAERSDDGVSFRHLGAMYDFFIHSKQ